MYLMGGTSKDGNGDGEGDKRYVMSDVALAWDWGEGTNIDALTCIERSVGLSSTETGRDECKCRDDKHPSADVYKAFVCSILPPIPEQDDIEWCLHK